MDFVLGKDCKVYCGAAGTQLSGLAELSTVRKAGLSAEAGEADVTTRANSGWRATAATLRSLSAELEVVFKPGDAGYETLRDAYLGGTSVCLAVLTGARDAAGSEGPHGDWAVTGFSRTEELEEGVVVTVTAKLTSFTAWVEVGAGS